MGSSSKAVIPLPQPLAQSSLSVKSLIKICMQGILKTFMNQQRVFVERPVAKISISLLIVLLRIYSCVMLWVYAFKQFPRIIRVLHLPLWNKICMTNFLWLRKNKILRIPELFLKKENDRNQWQWRGHYIFTLTSSLETENNYIF